MGARGSALICVLIGLSKFSFGQEIDLPNPELFQAYLDDKKHMREERVEAFIPLTITPTNSQDGIYQQILNHQLQQMQSYGLPLRQFQRWDGRLTVKRTSQPSRDPTGTMTFELQPITQQGSVNFQNIGRFYFQQQIFLHQSEFRFTPYRSRWSFSHVDTTEDTQNRLFYGWEW